MGAWGVSASAADSETRIERKACLRCSPCLMQLTDVSQNSREKEVRREMISVGIEAPAEPNKRFGVGA